MVRNDQVFFTGEEGPHRAFLYNFTGNHTEEFPNTLACRELHGSAYIHRTVYLFGGPGITAERCFLPSKSWTWRLAMPIQRSGFTPCTSQRRVSLCGGSAPLSHVFHINTEGYQQLPFTLPVGSRCIATMVQGNLIVEMQQYRAMWNGTEGLRMYVMDYVVQ